MARIIGILIVIGLVAWVLRRVTASKRHMNNVQDRPKPQFEKTVRCHRCGMHMPISLAAPDAAGHRCRDGCQRSSKEPEKRH